MTIPAAVFRFDCACCGRTVYMCRCYNTAATYGWAMRPEWEEARALAEAHPEDARREAQRNLIRSR